MDQVSRKPPVGIQSFDKIISNHNLYVDKTEFIYRLVHSNVPYFLTRPRRFGKSLLLSTMKAYWEGKKELFAGLKIEQLERENPDAWAPYPVFYLDFNKAEFENYGTLEAILDLHLHEWECIYGKTNANAPLGARFGQLIKSAHQKTGRRCVILVDEYDKPLLESMEIEKISKHNKAVSRGFFSALKSEDDSIQFLFITGVTKSCKDSLFSDLDQLRDISMSKDFADICGITEQELKENFAPEIENMAEEQDMSLEECFAALKQEYDGYHFHQKGNGVYNPYSLLSALTEEDFDAYWFETGTPTFLINRLKAARFDPRQFTNRTLYATKQMLKDYRDDNPDLIPLLYQSGYLTLIDYNPQKKAYTLGFPNDEVKYGFLQSLMPAYTGNVGAGSGKDILSLTEHLENGNLDAVKNVFVALFAGIPYPTNNDPFEHDFQTVIYITFTLLGHYVNCEQHTSTGRIDCIVGTENYIYLFEFKRDGSAEEALKQIEKTHYADLYAADRRRLYKIGVNFDSSTRQLSEWKVAER